MEGLASDAECLGQPYEEDPYFDRSFYRLCKLDNLYIFEIIAEPDSKIPPMKISDLNTIIFNKMKLGKACDIYQLTVEHLRYGGDIVREYILCFINRIVENIYFLSCTQLKLGLATSIHKGKKKPVNLSTSYRRITVTPILGAIIDYYLDPIAEAIFKPQQSPDQVGFTQGISYLVAAVQRGECQRWAVDKKQTCFGVSLDGEAAFPSVERDIQLRELYTVGERGDILEYSRNTYQNTYCHIKEGDLLSRRIQEHKGTRQGHVRASGHFKVYLDPCLHSLADSRLGFELGLLCVTVVCVADDVYLLSNSPSGLQAALNIIGHYALRYQLKFNALKTKVNVTGSKIDMAYYRDIQPWTLYGERLTVADTNEHLGLLVSGLHEEQLNTDRNIIKCRNALFSALGPTYSYKCLLSPMVQVYIWRTCHLPILLSGLPALPIRTTQIKSLEVFHHKILRGFLKVGKSSPVPALHFLLGELPIEGLLHIRTLGLLYNIASNPDSTAHSIVLYILQMCEQSSTTWSNYVKNICLKYGLPSPLSLFKDELLSKQHWKTIVQTKVTIWYERHLRSKANSNTKMAYLNVDLLGLSGKPHPALLDISSTQEVKKLRLHLKFLCGDFMSNLMLSKYQPSKSPLCTLCNQSVEESYEHVLLTCRSTSDVRERIRPNLYNATCDVHPTCRLLQYDPPPPVLLQFILDCSSINLPNDIRVPAHNPRISEIFKVSHDWCFGISNARCRLLSAD